MVGGPCWGRGGQSGFESCPPDSEPALLTPLQLCPLSFTPTRNQNQQAALRSCTFMALQKNQKFSFTFKRQLWKEALCFLGPQQVVGWSPREEPPHQPLYPQGACPPPRMSGNRRNIPGSGQPGPHFTHGETETQRAKGTFLLQASRISCKAGPQPLKLSSLPLSWKTRPRPVKGGLLSPLSSSGPFSRHLGDSPDFIDRQDSLESIWCTLLINLFQIIAENYWFM